MGNCVDKCWADFSEEFKFDEIAGLPLHYKLTGDLILFEEWFGVSAKVGDGHDGATA